MGIDYECGGALSRGPQTCAGCPRIRYTLVLCLAFLTPAPPGIPGVAECRSDALRSRRFRESQRTPPSHALHRFKFRNSWLYAATTAHHRGDRPLSREIEARRRRWAHEVDRQRRPCRCRESDRVATRGASIKPGADPRGREGSNLAARCWSEAHVDPTPPNGRGPGAMGGRKRARLFPRSLRTRTFHGSFVEGANGLRREAPLQRAGCPAHLHSRDSALLQVHGCLAARVTDQRT